MDTVIIVWKDGSWKRVERQSAWEYQNDPDWLTTIDESAGEGEKMSEPKGET